MGQVHAESQDDGRARPRTVSPPPEIPSPEVGAAEIEQPVVQREGMIGRFSDLHGGLGVPDGCRTDTVTLDVGSAARQTDLPPGPYVLLLVTDTGHGMSPEVQAKVFEWTPNQTGPQVPTPALLRESHRHVDGIRK